MAAVVLSATSMPGATAGPNAGGTLTICRENPIWFSHGGKALFLAGSHTWACFQERGIAGRTPDFDFPAYLDFMTEHGHNFLRLWSWEQTKWMQFAGADVPIRYEPLPYLRTGPGLARDGKPKFDLSRVDEAYFARPRERVSLARDRGIYVAVMFFQGFSVEQKGTLGVNPAKGNPWDGHPYHRDNNINDIDGDADGDGEGTEVHTLQMPQITRLQEAYVRKVVDTLNDFDHIAWEIGNECHPGSVEWHDHMIRFVRKCEQNKPRQHLVGMTGSPIRNPPLFASAADWISPVGKDYLEAPPPADGRKLIVVDTDHISPWGTEPAWVWKNLCRGNHFIVMDAYHDVRFDVTDEHMPDHDAIRRAMGDAVRLASRMNLAAMTPCGDLASSGYCLAAPGREYLIYVPEGGNVDLDLREAHAPLNGEWFETTTGKSRPVRTDGGGRRTLTAPFASPSVLWLKSEVSPSRLVERP